MKHSFFWVLFAFITLTHCQYKTPGGVKSQDVNGPQSLFQKWSFVNRAPTPIAQSARAVAKINTTVGNGTGFFVDFGDNQVRLVTNNHVLGTANCIKEGCPITLTFDFFPGGDTKRYEVYALPVGADVQADMSVFQIFEKGTTTPFVPPHTLTLHPLESGRALEGETLHLVGYPGDGFQKWTQAITLMGEINTFTSSALIFFGQSGSPFLNAQGEVVGILHSMNLGSGDAFISEAFGTPAHRLRALFDKSLKFPNDALSPLASLDAFPTDFSDPEKLKPFQASRKAPPGALLSNGTRERNTTWIWDFLGQLGAMAKNPFHANETYQLLNLLTCKSFFTYDQYSSEIINPWCPTLAMYTKDGLKASENALQILKALLGTLPPPFSLLHENVLTLPLNNDLLWPRDTYYEWVESLNSDRTGVALSPSTHASLALTLKKPTIWGTSVEDNVLAFLNRPWSAADLDEVSILLSLGLKNSELVPWSTPYASVAKAILQKWAQHPKRTLRHMIQMELYQHLWTFD